MQRGSWLIRPVVIEIAAGAPIETTGMSPADRDRLIALVRAKIEELLRGLGAHQAA